MKQGLVKQAVIQIYHALKQRLSKLDLSCIEMKFNLGLEELHHPIAQTNLASIATTSMSPQATSFQEMDKEKQDDIGTREGEPEVSNQDITMSNLLKNYTSIEKL